MGACSAVVLVVCAVLGSASGARAQEVGAQLAEPPAPAPDLVEPPAETVALRRHRDRDRTGWGTFGGHVGFFAGTAATAGLILAALEEPSLRPWVGASGIALTVGLTALGAWRVSVWADSGDWDPMIGWGFAGILPGAVAGMVAAAGTLMAVDAHAQLEPRLAVAGTGILLGAAAGYLGFRAMAEGRGNAGWETFAFWVGFFLSEVFALVSTAGASDTHKGLGLITIPVGATLSAAVVHLLLR